MKHTLRDWLYVCAAVIVLSGGCDGRNDMEFRPTVTPADPDRLAVARRRLAGDSMIGPQLAAGTGACDSPIHRYPVCEREGGQVLLLAASDYGGAGSRVDALLWVPPERSPRLSMLFWHIDSLGTPVGGGWYHVTAISHID